MKKILIVTLVLSFIMVLSSLALAGGNCATIKDGTILDIKGNPITTGYDEWGYNYQAHLFNGFYHNVSRPDPPWTKDTIGDAPSETWLNMKWSDEWLSNKDCNFDTKLDRGYSCDENASSSACDGAWETNHQWGSYEDEETGELCEWDYFVKIVYVSPEYGYKETDPVDGVLYWYTIEGDEKIGSVIWVAYARILQIYNEPCAGESGVEHKWETPAGFGHYKPKPEPEPE